MVMVERDAAVGWWDARYLDWAGAVASGLCALHCALLPMVAAALPIIGLGLLAGERAEAVLIGASAALGTISLALGFRRHRSGRALAALAIGLGMLALGRFAEAHDAEALGMVAVVSGGLAVAGSQLLNRRLCRSCPECREVLRGRGGSPSGPIVISNGDEWAGRNEHEAA